MSVVTWMTRQQIFNDNIKLAYHLAYKYQGSGASRGISLDDIKQEALMILWDVIPMWDKDKGALTTIFYRYGHQKLMRYINEIKHYNVSTIDRHQVDKWKYVRLNKSVRLEALSERTSPDSPESSVLLDEVLDILLDSHWDYQRTMAFLGRLDGYTNDDIATELGVSPQIVTYWVQWTEEMLRAKLDGTYEEPEFTSSSDTQKVCTKCRTSKDLKDFNKNSRTKLGVDSQCKRCKGRASSERRYKNIG